MSTYKTAETKHVVVEGVKFAYRHFGATASKNPPLVFNVHFRGTMDHWDPDLINPIAQTRPVILIDNSGVGNSGGEVPPSFTAWAQNVIAVLATLNIAQVDVLGFSMGGFVAQLIALDAPHMVRKLVIAGSGPSQGPGTETGAPEYFGMLASAATEEDQHNGFLRTFFARSDKKQGRGEEWWKRMTSARADRSDYVGAEGTQRQIEAVMRWVGGEHREEGSYDRLHEVRIPVLVANGSDDLLVPTVNSWVLYQRLVHSDAHLHLFPDSGHGFLNEYAAQFSRMVNEFLDHDD